MLQVINNLFSRRSMSDQILTSIHGNALGLNGKGDLCLKSQIVARVINNITPATITGVVFNFGVLQKNVLNLKMTNAVIPMVDNAGVVAYGSLKLADLPVGAFEISGHVNVTLTRSANGINADFDGDIAIGTDAANNTSSLGANEQNILPTTSTPQAVSGVSTVVAGNASKTVFTTTTAKSIYLNLLIDDTDHDITTTPSNILVNGNVNIVFSQFDVTF